MLVHKLKPSADNLRHRFKPTEDLSSSILVLEHNGRGTIMSGDFTNNGKFVS